MKCQHCGINFDDGDRECPICGASGGQPGAVVGGRGALSSGRTGSAAAPKQRSRPS